MSAEFREETQENNTEQVHNTETWNFPSIDNFSVDFSYERNTDGNFELVRVRNGYESSEKPATDGLRMEAEGPVIFCHDVGSSYDDLSSVKGIERYTGRVLAVTEPGDIVHLSPELEEDYQTIKEHYESVGLECATDIVWDMEPQPTPEGYERSDFLFSEAAHNANPDERRLQAVKKYNSKNEFVTMLQEEGHPTPQTDIYEHGTTPTQTFEGPWFVKGDVAASGTEVIKCSTWEEVVEAAASLNEGYQVQQSVGEDAKFLNVQYKALRNGEVEFLATTEQVLDGVAHAGNKYPSEFDPREVTDAIAERAGQDGLVGVFAFDVAVTDKGFKVIECNPRPNGASYPTAIAENLDVQEWSSANLATSKNLKESLGILEEAGLTYDRVQKIGAVVFNWGTASEGKLGVLLAGPESTQRDQLRAAQQLLSNE